MLLYWSTVTSFTIGQGLSFIHEVILQLKLIRFLSFPNIHIPLLFADFPSIKSCSYLFSAMNKYTPNLLILSYLTFFTIFSRAMNSFIFNTFLSKYFKLYSTICWHINEICTASSVLSKFLFFSFQQDNLHPATPIFPLSYKNQYVFLYPTQF